MADELYFDNGYADVGYVQRVIDAGVIGGTYVEDDYVDAGYADQDVIRFSLSAVGDVNLRIESGAITISSEFTTSPRGGIFVYLEPTNNFTWDEQDANWDDWYGDKWEPTSFHIPAKLAITSIGETYDFSGTVDIDSAFSVDASAKLFVEGTTDVIASAFTTTPSGNITAVSGAVDVDSAFSVEVDAAPYDFADATIESEFAVTSTARVQRNATSNIDSAFEVVPRGGFKFTAIATVSSAFTIDALGGTLEFGEPHTIESSFTTDAVGNITASGVSDIDTAFSLTALGIHLDSSTADITSEFTTDASGIVVRNGVSDIDTNFDIVTQGDVFVKGSILLSSRFDVTATGSYKFTVSPYRRFVISAEDRSGNILPESGIFALKSERRINIATAETRELVVPDDERTLTLDRSL